MVVDLRTPDLVGPGKLWILVGEMNSVVTWHLQVPRVMTHCVSGVITFHRRGGKDTSDYVLELDTHPVESMGNVVNFGCLPIDSTWFVSVGHTSKYVSWFLTGFVMSHVSVCTRSLNLMSLNLMRFRLRVHEVVGCKPHSLCVNFRETVQSLSNLLRVFDNRRKKWVWSRCDV
jgi:hypothetical protein